MTNQATEPEHDKKEGDRNESAPVDGSSKKDKGKEQMSSTDSSADKVVGEDQTGRNRNKRPLADSSADEAYDDMPLMKMIKLVKKNPKFVRPVRSLPGKDFVSKNSMPSSTAVSCSRGKNEVPEIPGLQETLDFCLSQQRASLGNNEGPEILLPEVVDSSDVLPKTGFKAHQIELKTGKEIALNVPGTSKCRGKRSARKMVSSRHMESICNDKHKIRCLNKGDMYPSLKGRVDWQLDAICALFQHLMREETETRLSDSLFTRVGLIVEVLTSGNVDGPCVKTAEELEELWKGSVAFCSCILSIYTLELYYLYNAALDPYFFYRKNVKPENMPENQDTEPGQEEKEEEEEEGQADQQGEEGQTDQRRNESAPVDGSSKKDKGKAPMSSTDSSADKVVGEDQTDRNRYKRALVDVSSEKDEGKALMSYTDPLADEVYDNIPLLEVLQMVKNIPKSLPPISFLFDKESTKDEGKVPMSSIYPGPISVKNKRKEPMVSIQPSIISIENKRKEPISSVQPSPISVKNKRKKPMSYTDPSEEKVFDENAHRRLDKGIIEKQEMYRKWGKLIKEMDVKSPGTENCIMNWMAKLTKEMNIIPGISKIKVDDMILAMRAYPEVQMEALCALYRQLTHTNTSINFPESIREKIELIVRFLTGGDLNVPCIKTSEDLDITFKGSVALCSCILSIYSRDLYHLYKSQLYLDSMNAQAGSTTPATLQSCERNRDWTKLTNDLLIRVLEKLALSVYFIRFAATCREILRVARDIHGLFPLNYPIVLIPHNKKPDQGLCSVYQVVGSTTFKLSMPQLRGKFIHGISKGWVGLSSKENKLSLLNLFTRKTLELPEPTLAIRDIEHKFDLDDRSNPIARSYLMKKMVVSNSTVSAGVDFVVGSLMGKKDTLFFSRLGDISWTCVNVDTTVGFREILADITHGHKDLAFFEGKLYAASPYSVLSVEIMEDTHECRRFGAPTKYYRLAGGRHKVYLVECLGSLLYVAKYATISKDKLVKTRGFEIHKLHLDRRSWVRTTDLGGHSLLLGGNESVAVLASQTSWCRLNTIYFVDDSSCGKGFRGDFGIYFIDNSVFQGDYGISRVETFDVCHSEASGISPSMWHVAPSQSR